MIIGVDPGLVKPAVVFLSENKTILEVVSPLRAFEGESLEGRYSQLAKFEWRLPSWMIVTADEPIDVVIEYPQYLKSLKGQKSADRQDLTKLCFAAGILFASLKRQYPFAAFFLYTPMEWKGQVPKKVTKQRMIKLYTDSMVKYLTEDAIDALALATYHYERTRKPVS